MKLEEGQKIAKKFIENFGYPHWFRRIEVCGSIRRKKPFINDIDIVVIATDQSKLRIEGKDMTDRKKIEFNYEGAKIDMYFADEGNFEVLKLIRTGSTEHNIKLCKAAIAKGWKLKANGEGLLMNGKISRTERGILELLLGKYIEPEERI